MVLRRLEKVTAAAAAVVVDVKDNKRYNQMHACVYYSSIVKKCKLQKCEILHSSNSNRFIREDNVVAILKDGTLIDHLIVDIY